MTTDIHTRAKLDLIQTDISRMRLEQAMQSPDYVPPPPRTLSRGLIFAITGAPFLVELIMVTVLTWKYLGSDKGLNMHLPDGSVVGGLHWDPFGAFLLSLVAALAWITLFAVPVLGPLVGTLLSVAYAALAYLASGSIAFGVFVLVLSLLFRIAMRTYGRPWLSVFEWGLAAAAVFVVMAPVDSLGPLRGFGGWAELRSVHDRHVCEKELRAGPWKGQYTETAAFYAQVKACARARKEAR